MLLRRLRAPLVRLPGAFDSYPGQHAIWRPTIPGPFPSATSFPLSQQQRYFAKKGIGRGGEKKPQGRADDRDVVDLLDIDIVRADMKREIESLKDDYIQQISVRPTLQAFERLVVKLPDHSEVPLNHLAQVSFKNPQLAIINLTASPHAVRAVADTLMQTGLCPNPQIQTTLIYVPLPKPTREYRETLVKNAKSLFNRCHDRLRAVETRHQHQLRQFEKTAPIDTYRNAQTTLHALMKEYARQAEEAMKAKQKELMEEI